MMMNLVQIFGNVFDWMMSLTPAAAMIVIVILAVRRLLRDLVSPKLLYWLWLLLIVRLLVPSLTALPIAFPEKIARSEGDRFRSCSGLCRRATHERRSDTKCDGSDGDDFVVGHIVCHMVYRCRRHHGLDDRHVDQHETDIRGTKLVITESGNPGVVRILQAELRHSNEHRLTYDNTSFLAGRLRSMEAAYFAA